MGASPETLVETSAHLTVGDLLREQTMLQPEAIAIEDGTRHYTYAQFNERVNRLANHLEEAGIERGDRIAVLAENCIEYIEIVYAAAKRGAVLCALNWRLAADQLKH